VNEAAPRRTAPSAEGAAGVAPIRPDRPVARGAFVAGVSAAAAGLALIFFLSGPRAIVYDSYHYYELSRIVASEGLGGFQSLVRTYGYPLFLAAARGFRETTPETAHALAAALQVLLHLAASFAAASVAGRLFRDRRVFAGVFAAAALNPILLLRATEMLSDSPAASLTALAVFLALPRSGRPALRAFTAFLCAGTSAALRPASIVLLPALALVWILRAHRYGERPLPTLAAYLAAALGAVLPLAPEVASNARAYDRWTPLVVEGLYRDQAAWGTGMLKYGTSLVSDRPPQIVYENPFVPGGAAPAELARTRPLAYAKTLGAHLFGMLDQDFPYTYVENLRPPARWPLSIAAYAFLFCGLAGMGLGLARVSAPWDSTLYFGAALLSAGALVAIYLPVAVESRFSVPLYLLLTPAAVHAVLWLSQRRSGTIVAAAIAGGGFVAACVQLSRWMTTLIR
jgi:hypothetical protein